MDLDDVKEIVARATDNNYEEVDIVCLLWLEGITYGHGKDGETARKLLAIVRELIDIDAGQRPEFSRREAVGWNERLELNTKTEG